MLQAHGDAVNAAHAAYLEIRRCLLLGRLGEAEGLLGGLRPALLPAALQAFHALALAGIAMRRLDIRAAHSALADAAQAA
ncbi:hypothetical protein ACPXBC_29430, partial [Escherichia coli]|uniref:hypothetical protein n=1 Tax=Escherichia coli TaxID=562 RepID=UPI003CE53A28